jgi:CHASE2 domain-containing sensor protein
VTSGARAHRWYVPAVARFAIGMLTGLATALLLVIAVTLFPGIDDYSRDMGLRVAAALHPPALALVEKKAGIEGYIYLDADPGGRSVVAGDRESSPAERLAFGKLSGSDAACRALADDPASRQKYIGPSSSGPSGNATTLDCSELRPLNRYLLAELVEGTFRRGARFVVLDVELGREPWPFSPGETDSLARVLAAHVGAVAFVAPYQALPGLALTLEPAPTAPIVSDPQVQMGAPALLSASAVARRYFACAEIRQADASIRLLPSLPYLVAQRLQGVKLSAARCETFREERDPRIDYKFPGASNFAGETGSGIVPNPIYQRCPAELFWRADAVCGDEATYAGRVVVIGSSSPARRDVHLTPLGTMSGADVIVNAIRSFLLHPSPVEESAASEALHELLIITFTAGAWALSKLLQDWRTKNQPHKRRWLSLVIRVIAFLVTATLIVVVVIASSFGPDEPSPKLDILIPVVAIGLEIFAETIAHLSAMIERWIHSRLGNGQAA